MLAKNREVLASGTDQYMPIKCPTCGQILEPEWNRCPFCSEPLHSGQSTSREPVADNFNPIGYLMIKTGPDRGKSFRIDNNVLYIGSGNQNDIVINDNKVAQRHSKIWGANNKFFIQDLQSDQGTKVNNNFIEQVELYDNDLIEITGHFFIFKILN